MATYLELCQALRREVGASGNDATTQNATGEWARICSWVAAAWEEIQGEAEEPGFEFMRKSFSFLTVPLQAEYPPADAPLSLADFSAWVPSAFKLYQTSVGDEVILPYMPYELFRDTYLLGSFKVSYSVPSVATIAPNKAIILALPPLGEYTVSGEYYRTPTKLEADGDVPTMPERFHRAIVYRAMMHYGMYEAAQEIVQRGTQEYRRFLDRIYTSEMPEALGHRSLI